jgi:fibronectin-binding autotransporter adhesin
MKSLSLRCPLSGHFLLPFTVACLSLAAPLLRADNGTWSNPATGGLWGVTGNWTGGIVAEGPGFAANFGNIDITADNAVALDAPHTLAALTFGDSDVATPANWVLHNNLDGLNVLTLNSAPATVTVNALGGGSTATISAPVAGTLGLTKAGTGQLNLTGVNTYTGATSAAAGILSLETGGVINAGALNVSTVAGAKYVGNGGSLTSAALSTIQGIGGGGFFLQSGSASFNGGIRTGTQPDPAIIRIDGGTFTATTLELRRTQAYVSALPALRSVVDVGTNGLYVTGGSATIGTLSIGTSNSSASARVDGGDLTVTGPVNIGNTANNRWSVLQVKGGTFNSTDSVNGVVLGLSATSANPTELYLSGGTANVEIINMGNASTVTGGAGHVHLNGGALYLGSGGIVRKATGTYVAIVTLAGGTLGAKGDWSSPANVGLTTGAVTTNNATIKAADAADAARTITVNGVISGASGFTKSGAGTLILTATNAYDGSGGLGTVISAGTLQIGAGGTSGTLGLGPVLNNANLTFNRSDTLTVANVITGTGTLTKSGTGTVSLTAANTFAGTTVATGTLALNNTSGSATGTGPVAVQSGATLAGTGVASGNVSVQAGGIIAPGASVGSLTAGSLDLAAGSELHFEFKSGANDQIAVPGNLALNGGAVRVRQENTVNPWSTLAKYYLIKYGTLSGTGIGALTVSNPVSGTVYTFGTEVVGADNFITLTLSSAGTPNTWNVNASGTWSTAANWTTGIPGGIGNPVNFLGVIAAARSVTLDTPRTAGSLNFDNGNSYTLTGSILTLDNGASPAAVNVSSGFQTIESAVGLSAPGLNTNGVLVDASLTMAGVVSGPAALRHTGPGILRLTNTNTYTGGTTLAGNGVVEILNGASTGNGPLTWAGNGTLRSIAPLTLAANASIAPSSAGAIDTAGGDISASGLISGAGTLVKTGGGTLTLSNPANAYTGSTLIKQGNLAFSALNNLGTGGINFDGGALVWKAPNTSDVSTRPVAFLAGGATLNTGGNDVTLTLPVGETGLGGLTKTGAGKLTLAAANTYTGRTSVFQGTLAITTADQLGSAPLAPVARHLVLDGGTLLIDSSLALPATTGLAVGSTIGTIEVAAGMTTTIAGSIADNDGLPGVLDLTGLGTVTFAASSTFTGGGAFGELTVNANATNAFGTGVITLDKTVINSANNVFLPNGLQVNSTALINLNNGAAGTTLAGPLTGSGILTMSATAERGGVSGDWTAFAGDLILTGGGEWRIIGFNDALTNSKVKIDATTELVLAVNPSVGVPRIIRIGQLTGTGALGGQPVVGRSVNWHVGGLGLDSTFDGIIKDNMSQVIGTGNAASDFTKDGAGALTLTGNSSYTGTTTITAGTLMVNGDHTAATGTVTVTTGTLAGSGTLGGVVTVQSAGFLNPGAAIGTLTVPSTVLEGTLITQYDNAHANRIDKLAVTGDLTLSTTSALDLQGIAPFPSGPRVIASYRGTLTGTFGTLTGVPAGYVVNYAFNDGVTTNNIALVPGFSSPAYNAWAAANTLTGPASAPAADPDNDGLVNLLEFALDGNPNAATDSGKSRVSLTPVGAGEVLTLTIPVRTGATFSGATAQTAVSDGITYTIEGTNDLNTWNTMVISEVTPTASAGLPALTAGWTYRTFRTPDNVTADDRDYLRVKVTP